ncbi:MAG: hypothetical protein IH600_12415 [Bacteroidetes bacterium]|nr:hypothetical protein [Bacteroidota bacterium]
MDDIHCYSIEHVRAQAEVAMARSGYYELRFYAESGRPAREKTDSIETFYYYPSGGTIRDREMNIVYYEPKLDKYHTSNRDV